MLKSIFKTCFAAVILVLIIFNSAVVMQSVKDRLLLCYNSVIPSLYIFMVFSKYISRQNTTGFLSYPFGRYSKLMKIKDKKYPVYLLLSLLGGFAVGATFLNELEKDGYNENCLVSISPTMINNSMSFCIIAVGAGYLGNTKIGIMLFIALTAAGLITGFIFSFIFKYNIVAPLNSGVKKQYGFVDCINSSVQSIISICGFVVLFYTLCKVFNLYSGTNIINLLLSVFTEITCGCNEICLNRYKNLYLLCFALSIFPVSTLCQIYYFTHNSKVIKSLLLSRFIHTPISIIVFSLLLNIFPQALDTIHPDSIAVRTFNNSMEISAVLFLITLCFICIFDSNRLFTKQKN